MRGPALALVVAILGAACGDAGSGAIADDADSGAARPLELTDPTATPPVDRGISIVDPGLVLFDTFDGGSVSLDRATPELVDRLFDAIEPIDAPAYESAGTADDWLRADDVVVGYIDPDGGAWAYPVRILNFHEIVNDELGGQPVLISYCPLCGSGVVYDRDVDGRRLSFSNTSALYENDLVMVDRETGTYWWQVPGRAIVGELSGTELTALVGQTTTWSRWVADHPDTLAMVRPEGRDYSRDPFLGYSERVDDGFTPFPVRAESLADDRLSPGTPVVVAFIDDRWWAWAATPATSVELEVDGLDVEVVTDGVGGRVTIDGDPAPVRTMLWFAAVGAYPEIVLGS